MKYRINKKWTPAVAMDVVITLMERTREEAVDCAGARVAKKASRRDPKEAAKIGGVMSRTACSAALNEEKR